MTAPRTLVVGTRASALALAQTNAVCAALRGRDPGLEIRVERITTTGDARVNEPLSQLGRGAFVTEIEAALRERRIDFAVHSAKDLPSTLAADLLVAAYLPRADARDVLVSPLGTLEALPAGARVGTSSPRRMTHIRSLRPDVVTVEMRGNVDTRLRKLAAGEFDAIVLAAAGLERLGRGGEATQAFDTDTVIPCVGQGALALEARADDRDTLALLATLDDAATRTAVECERAFLAELGAGCRAAAAAHARVGTGGLELSAMIGATDGRLVRGREAGAMDEGPAIGVTLAHRLLVEGGAEFLGETATSLRGRRIAITRPEGQADALAALLRARGADPVSCPTIAIEPLTDPSALDRELQRLAGAQWMVFTSMNAVTSTAERLATLGLPLPARLRTAAVGRATATLVNRHFGRVDFLPTRATAEALGAELPVRHGEVVVFPRGSLAADDMIATLKRRGAVVRDVVVYRTLPGPAADRLAELVRDNAVDAIVFTSPSSVRFATDIGPTMRSLGADAPRAVSMGPSTTRAAHAVGISVEEPATQGIGAIVETLERLLAAPKASHV